MRVLVLMQCAVLAGCVEFSPQACPAGLMQTKTAELFFGRNTGAAESVNDADWQIFVDTEIAVRFPGGFTVSDVSGAWRDESGRAVRERTKRLFIVLPGTPDEPAKLAAIRAAYRARFHQDSVMLIENEGCVSL